MSVPQSNHPDSPSSSTSSIQVDNPDTLPSSTPNNSSSSGIQIVNYFKSVGSTIVKFLKKSTKSKMADYDLEKEIRELSVDMTVSGIERVAMYKDSKYLLIRIFLVKSIPQVAREVGFENIEKIIEILDEFLNQKEAPIRVEVVKQAYLLIPFLFANGDAGYNICLESILPIFSDSLTDVSATVRTAAVSAFGEFAKQLKPQDLEERIIKTIRILTNDTQEEDHRIVAAQLLASLANILTPELTQLNLLPLAEKLSQDPVFRPRKALASIIGTLAKHLPPEPVSKVLFPLWAKLVDDKIWGVRKGCTLSAFDLATRLDPETLSGPFLTMFINLCSDNSRWVRIEAVKAIPLLFLAFQNEKIPDILLFLFFTVSMNATNLTANYIKRKAREADLGLDREDSEFSETDEESETETDPEAANNATISQQKTTSDDQSGKTDPETTPITEDGQPISSSSSSDTSPADVSISPTAPNDPSQYSSKPKYTYTLNPLSVKDATMWAKKLNLNSTDAKKRAQIASYHLPAVVYALGPHNWDCLQEAFHSLAHHTFFKVRQTIGSTLVALAEILGPELTRKVLYPVLLNYLHDVNDVQASLTPNLSRFLVHIPVEDRIKVLDPIVHLAKDPDSWRFRRSIAFDLVRLSFLFPPSTVVTTIFPLALSLCQDSIMAVRVVAQFTIGPLFLRFLLNTPPLPVGDSRLSNIPTHWGGGDPSTEKSSFIQSQYVDPFGNPLPVPENIYSTKTNNLDLFPTHLQLPQQVENDPDCQIAHTVDTAHDDYDYFDPYSRINGLIDLGNYLKTNNFGTLEDPKQGIPSTLSKISAVIISFSTHRSYIRRQDFIRISTSLLACLPLGFVSPFSAKFLESAFDRVAVNRILIARFFHSSIIPILPESFFQDSNVQRCLARISRDKDRDVLNMYTLVRLKYPQLFGDKNSLSASVTSKHPIESTPTKEPRSEESDLILGNTSDSEAILDTSDSSNALSQVDNASTGTGNGSDVEPQVDSTESDDAPASDVQVESITESTNSNLINPDENSTDSSISIEIMSTESSDSQPENNHVIPLDQLSSSPIVQDGQDPDLNTTAIEIP